MNDRKETILNHLQNLGRGHYLRGMSIVLWLILNKGELSMGMTNIWERHEENPILHEPGESPSLGFQSSFQHKG